MPNWLALLLGILPHAIVATEQAATDLAGGQKKQMVTDIMQNAVNAVTQVAPEHAPAATAAMQTANGMIDSFVNMFNAIGVFQHKTTPAIATPSTPVATPATPTTGSSL